MRVQCSEEESEIAENRETAVRRHGAVCVKLRQCPSITPYGHAGSRIKGHGVISRTGHKHDAIHHQRRDFNVRAAKLKRPLRSKFSTLTGVMDFSGE